MRTAKQVAFLLVVAFVATVVANESPAGAPVIQYGEPDYYLTFAPAGPVIGKEVTVSLASRPGMPAVGGVRWTLAGAPASNAGVKGGNAATYSFVPTVPGTYVVTAEFRDPRGATYSSTLEIAIGGGLATHEMVERPGIPQMFLNVVPQQPRAGQPVTFTFQLGNGIPDGGQVRWELSGPPASIGVSGRNQEVCTFVPPSQGSYVIRSALYDARGSLMGEVSLGFYAMP